MSPPVDRIPSDDRLPEAVDVVVIGAGIIGVAAAYHLAKKGRSVALIEKGHVGAEQSSRNWGWCRQQGRDRHEIPLARISLETWGKMREEIGADVGFRRTGVLWVTKDPKELASWERWADFAREVQVHSRVLTAADVETALPGNTENWIGGLHTPSDGRAEPSMAAPALAAAARRLGVSLHQDCAARGIETRAGAVHSVATEKGRIRTQAVLLAGGAWSSLFCRRHGIDLPQAMVRATAFRTTAAPEITEGALGTPGYCLRRRLDGGYTVALRGYGTVDLTPDEHQHRRRDPRLGTQEVRNQRQKMHPPEGNRAGDRDVPGRRRRLADRPRSAAATSPTRWRALSRQRAPASVRLIRRVVRFSRRVPRRSSSAATARVTSGNTVQHPPSGRFGHVRIEVEDGVEVRPVGDQLGPERSSPAQPAARRRSR